ncbi:MAG: DUF433 domain-containing protein [Acidobacteriota bacterium]
MKAVTATPKIRTVVAKTAKLTTAKRRTRAVPPITINPQRLGGTPTIAGTRLPVVALIDYLNDDQAIANFKADFPGITDEQIQAVIERIREALEDGWLAERVNY